MDINAPGGGQNSMWLGVGEVTKKAEERGDCVFSKTDKPAVSG